MLITLFSYWGVGLPVGYMLGLTEQLGLAQGPAGLWQGLIVGLSCAAVMLGMRLHKISRRHIYAAI
jgi:MATE family multidrug resistance protein